MTTVARQRAALLFFLLVWLGAALETNEPTLGLTSPSSSVGDDGGASSRAVLKAAVKGNHEKLASLLASGVSPNEARDPKSQMTALNQGGLLPFGLPCVEVL